LFNLIVLTLLVRHKQIVLVHWFCCAMVGSCDIPSHALIKSGIELAKCCLLTVTDGRILLHVKITFILSNGFSCSSLRVADESWW